MTVALGEAAAAGAGEAGATRAAAGAAGSRAAATRGGVGKHAATREGVPMRAKTGSGSPGRHRALERDPAPKKAAGSQTKSQKRKSPAQKPLTPTHQGPPSSGSRKGSGGGRRAAERAAGGILRGGRGGRSSGRSLLVGELLVCMLVTALSPLTDKHADDPQTQFIKRLSAVAATFLLLGLISTGGRGASRVAGALGAVVTVALLVSERDVFVVLANRFGGPPDLGPAGPDPVEQGSGDNNGRPGRLLDAGGGALAPR